MKVIYLLGAGASASALPTINHISKDGIKIPSIGEDFKALSDSLIKQILAVRGKNREIENIIESLKWLSEKTHEHGSPDMFAKYLYLVGDIEGLKNLKQMLSFYFVHRQFIDNKRDPRALAFLITLLDDNFKFPENIKILNWNYDLQLELASSNFPVRGIANSTNTFFPGIIKTYPSLGEDNVIESKDKIFEIDMLHLNGVAGYFHEHTSEVKARFSHSLDLKELLELLEQKKIEDIARQEFLTFGWDSKSIFNAASQQNTNLLNWMLKDANILVVIGYSFPFFNRLVDTKIFDILKGNESFYKIYYQDPDPRRSGKSLYNQFGLDEDRIDIEHVIDVNNYFVPHEL